MAERLVGGAATGAGGVLFVDVKGFLPLPVQAVLCLLHPPCVVLLFFFFSHSLPKQSSILPNHTPSKDFPKEHLINRVWLSLQHSYLAS